MKKATTLTQPSGLIQECQTRFPNQNRSEAIREALKNFLALPAEQRTLNKEETENILAERLSPNEELTLARLSIRFSDAMLKIIEKLAKDNKLTLNETVTGMLVRVLYQPPTAVSSLICKFLTIHGNKWNKKMIAAVQNILNTAAKTWKTSVETCAGGLGLFSNFDFAPQKILNDNNWEIANLLKVIKDTPHELLLRLHALVADVTTFNKLKNMSVKCTKKPNIDAAVRFLFLNLTSCRGLCESWDAKRSLHYAQKLEAIYPLHIRLQKTEILDLDILQVLGIYKNNRNTLFIVDPPYLDTKGYETRMMRKVPKYGKSFGIEEHRKLAARLLRIKENEGNDFIYFCRVTATRHVTTKGKERKNTPEEIAQMDQWLERKIDRMYWGKGLFYIDIQTHSDGTTERIITSFNFQGATPYGKGVS